MLQSLPFLRRARLTAMAALGAALGVGFGGPLLLWILPLAGWGGDITLELWRTVGSATAAAIGGETEIWMDSIARAVGAMLGSGILAQLTGCSSRQSAGASVGAIAGYGVWFLSVVAIGLLPALKWVLIAVDDVAFGLAMYAAAMVGAAFGSLLLSESQVAESG